MTPKSKAEKRRRAVGRKKDRNQLSPETQLAFLDEKFGPGKGAQLERTRLQNIINNRDGKIGA